MDNTIPTVLAMAVMATALVTTSAKPENKAVKIGQNAELEYDFTAAPPDDRKWTKAGTSPLDVADKDTGTGNTKYDEAVTGNVWKLTIKNVDKDDGELYTCSSTTPSHSAYANLVALGTPVCTLAIQAPDKIEFTCELEYGGNLEPKLKLVQTESSLDSTGGSAADGKVSHTGEVPASGLDTKSFTCSVTFTGVTLPTEPTGIDNTVPVYTETCTVAAAQPASVTITPAGATFDEGDKLTCTATGTPTPNFVWSDGTNDLPSSNGVLTLTTDMAGKTLTCTASNNINSASNTRDVTTVEATTAGPSTVPFTNVDNTVTETDAETSSQSSAICLGYHELGIAASFLSVLLF